jgi:anaerobic magnesium-protoporphyrin IX monomethyl ester cyclase
VAVGLESDVVERAIAVLRTPSEFYNYRRYRDAAMLIKRWLNALSVYGSPGQFDGFNMSTASIVNYSNISDLTDPTLIARLAAPFDPYFRGPFVDALQASEWRLVGISLNYMSQLPFVVFMSGLIKKIVPDCFLCLGGTELTAEVKELRETAAIWRLFPSCDGIVVGEGGPRSWKFSIPFLRNIYRERTGPG